MRTPAGSWKHVPNGTWLVLVLAAFFLVIGLGNIISRWDHVTSDLAFAISALLGVLLPVAALAWGVHLARRAASS